MRRMPNQFAGSASRSRHTRVTGMPHGCQGVFRIDAEATKLIKPREGFVSHHRNLSCVRLQQIPGVGPLVSTAVVSAIGNGAAFKKGREFAAWLGLVLRQWSTGGKAKLLGISKRGNPHLRKMFIHGARAAVLRVKREGSNLGTWMSGLETRAVRNVVIVATATKHLFFPTRRSGFLRFASEKSAEE